MNPSTHITAEIQASKIACASSMLHHDLSPDLPFAMVSVF